MLTIDTSVKKKNNMELHLSYDHYKAVKATFIDGHIEGNVEIGLDDLLG